MLRRSKIIPAILAIVPATAFAASLDEARWLAPGADIVSALTSSPGVCIAAPKDIDAAYKIDIGRTAFESPLLLGGQAARAGLSCASCHVDGASNPDFFLEGLSAAPGTADVTSSIFSKVREDGEFNPIAIPSLVGAGKKQSFGKTSPAPSLHAFIGSAVVDEFAAEAPAKGVLAGLVAYIEALDASACPQSPVRVTSAYAMEKVRKSVAAAERAAGEKDLETADFLLASAQIAIGRIDARFPGKRNRDIRGGLAALSKAAGKLRAGSDAAEFSAFQGAAANLEIRLGKRERNSLYDPDALSRYLKKKN